MSTPFLTFEEFSDSSRNTYRFFNDRIERDWKVIVRRGQEVYPTADVSEHLGTQTTFAFGLSRTLRSLAVYLIGALILTLGFEHEILRGIGYVLFLFAALACVLALMKMKKDTWLYVKRRDGSTLFCVRERGLKGISSDEFVAAIRRYAQKG